MEEWIMMIGCNVSNEYANMMIDRNIMTAVVDCTPAVPRDYCCVKWKVEIIVGMV